VQVVYLPEGPEGAKVGLDDWFVAGGTVEQLEELAKPWDGKGPGVWLRDGTESDVDTLRRERDAARADKSALIAAILNPELTRAQLITAVAVASEARAKQSRGEVEANGRVVLSASEIADDWRPEPEKGGRVIPLNPRNGRRPRMARDKVKAVMVEAVDNGLIAAHPLPAPRKHANGTRYKATDWVVEPVDSLAAALKPWTTYRLNEPKTRKLRTISPPCPECGEIHPIKRQDMCMGCGALLAEKIIEPEVEPEPDETASDNLSEADSKVAATVKPFPLPPLVRTVLPFGGGTDHNALREPEWLQAAPDPWSG
jgi:hypothetical protein